jgi:DNA-binding NtrC family response regulator
MLRENFPTLRVLITEDELLIRWSLAQTLAAAGAVVTEVADGHAALAAVRSAPRPFDVVVLDLRLPDSSGLGLLASIRRLSPASRVLVMTADWTPELCHGARALGAAAVLDKPFDLDAMAALVLEPAAAA